MIFNWNQTLLQLLPEFTRARGPYLYTRKGDRYLDLWLMGGFALMGHRAGRITQVLKNRVSTGLVFDLPSIHQKRLIKTLEREFPEYGNFRIYNSWEQAKSSIETTLDRTQITICDPLLTNNGGIAALWRPFAPDFKELPQVILPVFPFQIGGGPVIAGFKKKHKAPVNEFLASPLLCEALTRSIYDLKKFIPPCINTDLTAINNWNYQHFYFIPRYSESEYQEIFKCFLSNKIIISPHHHCPSFLCAEISNGDTKKLINLLKL
ncbi:MAG: hypothetical protein JXR70_18170 [Spirochaetales bacterium]|nr:hypothetical protein [Spirochaetales bacterium]